ncbi:MAG: SDR family oxidoreductase [Rhodospirillaceae bacterium]|nr:SDR family oxidoreductase [Rhodospirillaceae bacterium]
MDRLVPDDGPKTARTAGRLAGKRALVTAAGAGIGRATAAAFAREGATVRATDIDLAAVEDLAAATAGSPGVLTPGRLDVTDPVAIARMADELGTVDVLVNCAGFVDDGSVLACDEAAWERSLTLNVTSMYRTIRAFLPAMLAQGSGSIVNMASVAGAVAGVPNRFVYSATKAAIVGLTRSVARDFADRHIRCNAVCPGTVHTPSWEDRVRAAPDPERAKADFIARQPMGRLGTPQEVAQLCVYLASDESAYTTGAIHVIDGGWTI